MKFQIHQQKCHFRGNVATAQPGAELDTVEYLDPLRSKANVLAVEVAVNVSNPTVSHAAREQFTVAANKIRTEIIEGGESFFVNQPSDKRLEIGQILGPFLFHSLRVAGDIYTPVRLRSRMEGRENFSQIAHHFSRRLAGFQKERQHT
ncbi:MAG TPA: hypothetical protein VFM35_08065, partial [Candidatus Binatia bacterium]|nr:hypothetical protein [Candidatus Binatia bacterium]